MTAGPLTLDGSVDPGVLLVNVAAFSLFAFVTTQLFQSETPLALPGSQALRLNRAQAVDLRSLVAAIDRQCSSFITFPGMDSLYVWTDQEPPSDMRYGLWWLSLDSSHQETIVQQLQNRSRLCVVKNQSVNDFWAEGRPIPQRPLVTFIDQSFVDAGSFGDYQLLVRSSLQNAALSASLQVSAARVSQPFRTRARSSRCAS